MTARLVRITRYPSLPPVLPAVGMVILAVFVVGALIGPLFLDNPPSALIGTAFDPPGATLLGTDFLGRDLFSRMVYGARLTLLISFAATTIGFVAGAAIGFAAAERGGWWEDGVDAAVNILLSFPPLMLGLLVVAALSSGLPVLIGAIAFIQMPRVVRIAKAVGAGISSRQFVEVARARGEGLGAILWHDILPNATRPLMVEYGLRLTYSVLFISGLSFLGLGVQPPDADWGGLVRENLEGIYLGQVLPPLVPALAIGLFSVALNLIIDWAGSNSSQIIPEELR